MRMRKSFSRYAAVMGARIMPPSALQNQRRPFPAATRFTQASRRMIGCKRALPFPDELIEMERTPETVGEEKKALA